MPLVQTSEGEEDNTTNDKGCVNVGYARYLTLDTISEGSSEDISLNVEITLFILRDS